MKALLLMLLICYTSCLSENYQTRLIRYRGIFPEDNNELTRTFFMDVPKKGKLLKGDELITGDYHTEYRISYPDSSIIYITNDEWSGSILNVNNLGKIGINAYHKKHLLDTLDHRGKQSNGKFWRDYVIGKLVVGYINVPINRLSEFDKSLESIRARKKN
ncbi:MAG: hypothetical protein ACK57K_05505 [Chryseotalea sp.]|jgi:hypothetical protein